tara:strand:- start:2213 stop:2884 length:672 start_codon:yes stop_codon:yes gene_type:complete
MNKYINTPKFSNLDSTLPVFPLAGTIILPKTELPLHIFEEKYREMVEDSLKKSKLIGIIQPKETFNNLKPDLYKIGCAGRIISFRETEDGRYYISLNGICRFISIKELDVPSKYRQLEVDYSLYTKDLDDFDDNITLFERKKLFPQLKKYFELHNFKVDLNLLENISDHAITDSLSMSCPFQATEKQALIESKSIEERAKAITSLIDMAINNTTNRETNNTLQ